MTLLCPICDAVHTVQTPLTFGTPAPEPGDCFVCTECFQVLIFDGDPERLRRPKYRDVTGEGREAFRQAQEVARRLKVFVIEKYRSTAP